MFFFSTTKERQAHMKTKFHIKLMVEAECLCSALAVSMIEFTNFLNDINRLYQPRMLLASQSLLPLFLHFYW